MIMCKRRVPYVDIYKGLKKKSLNKIIINILRERPLVILIKKN